MFGNQFSVYNDGLILSYFDFAKELELYYCRADKHDELVAQMTGEFTPTGYCYTYIMLENEAETLKEYGYLLTEEQEKAVNEVLNTVKGTVRAENATYNSD